MQELLLQMGLSPEEAAVYQVLLNSGGAKATAIARLMGIRRTSCREYLSALEAKGFINSAKIGNKYYYQAEDPDRFRQIAEERNFLLDRLLPELRQLSVVEAWQVQSIDQEDLELELQRAKRKNQSITNFGNSKNGGAIVNGKTLLLHSTAVEMPALKINSTTFALFHQALVGGTPC